MTTMLPPVYGVAFEFDVVLFAQSDNQIKTTPTIAAGDFVLSKSNGATANLTTTPSESPASSGIVRVQLSATEMEADKLTVKWHDASGAEWNDGAVCIHTTGQTFDALKALIDDLESRLTATRAGYLDNLSGGAAALEATAQSILTDTGTTLDALIKDIPTTAEFVTALASADDAVLAAIAALNNLSSAGAQAAAAAALTAYGAATATNVAAVVDAVWDEATAGHVGVGSTGAAIIAAGNAGDPWATELPGAYTGDQAGNIVGNFDADALGAEVWTYSPRTLTATAAQVAAAVSGSDLTIHRGDTFSASLTGLGDIQSRTQLYWTVKESVNQADTRAAVQVEEDAGLVYLRGAAGTANQGDITVTNAATGAITLTLAAAASAELTPGTYYYDVQQVTAAGVETLTAGALTVVADVTRAVV